MRIAIIDYGSGNLRSAAKAFEQAGAFLDQLHVQVTDRAEDIHAADRIVLPGQGAFAECMRGLSALPGMQEALEENVRIKKKPFFGICVGMQLLAERGLEHGEHKGLGWVKGEVVPLTLSDPSLKIPHMGWNNLRVLGCEGSGVLGEENITKNPRTQEPMHPLLKGLDSDPYVYFVHSYALRLKNQKDELASCDYGGRFTAFVAHENIAGTQFHPEKSQKTGLQLLRNFLEWRP
jgi:glutamine amidotransferase